MDIIDADMVSTLEEIIHDSPIFPMTKKKLKNQ